jgi:phage gp16-like protein
MATNVQLAKIHIAKKDLSMTDVQYREALQGHFGKRSAKELSNREANGLIDLFKRWGYKPKPARRTTSKKPGSGKPSNWNEPGKIRMYKKLYAMICHNKNHRWSWGYVRGTAQKMFEKQRDDVVLEWLTETELYKLVQTLQIRSNHLGSR